MRFSLGSTDGCIGHAIYMNIHKQTTWFYWPTELMRWSKFRFCASHDCLGGQPWCWWWRCCCLYVTPTLLVGLYMSHTGAPLKMAGSTQWWRQHAWPCIVLQKITAETVNCPCSRDEVSLPNDRLPKMPLTAGWQARRHRNASPWLAV